jgi:hypothetical protein
MFSRVWKIENAHRIGSVIIDEALNPFSPISHGSDLLCGDEPPPFGLD